jgi:hypothetical protein
VIGRSENDDPVSLVGELLREPLGPQDERAGRVDALVTALLDARPGSTSAGSLITATPRAASRSLILGLCTTCPRLNTVRPDSAAASVSSTAFLTPKQNPFSRARRTSIDQVYGPHRDSDRYE